MNRYLSFIVLGVVSCASNVCAEQSKVGSAGAQFLKIGIGSRYQGIGEASVAQANDVNAMYWNPAGLAAIEGTSASFTNVNWLADLDLNYVAVARYFEDLGVFGLSATVLSGDDQEITTFQDQDGTGQYYTTTSYAIGLSFARQLTAKFAFGTTVKYVGEKIHLERASGWAFDFGTMLHTGFKSLRLGMSISNMGPQMKFSGPNLAVRYGDGSNPTVPAELSATPYNLPLTFRVGVAYDVPIGTDILASISTELKHPGDNLQQGAFGTELTFREKFFLRGGYKVGYEEEDLSLGAGIVTPIAKSTKLAIDYAWQNFGRLESSQRFSVGFLF